MAPEQIMGKVLVLRPMYLALVSWPTNSLRDAVRGYLRQVIHWAVVLKRLNSPPVDLSHWIKLMHPDLNAAIMSCLSKNIRPSGRQRTRFHPIDVKSVDLHAQRTGPTSDFSGPTDTTLIDEIDKTQRTTKMHLTKKY